MLLTARTCAPVRVRQSLSGSPGGPISPVTKETDGTELPGTFPVSLRICMALPVWGKRHHMSAIPGVSDLKHRACGTPKGFPNLHVSTAGLHGGRGGGRALGWQTEGQDQLGTARSGGGAKALHFHSATGKTTPVSKVTSSHYGGHAHLIQHSPFTSRLGPTPRTGVGPRNIDEKH